MSHATPTYCLSFLRWNLDSVAAALWLLASKRASQPFNARTTWTELDPHWDPSSPLGSDESCSLRESISECRPAALVIGIDRASFIQTASRSQSLREFCNRFALEIAAPSKKNVERIFLIAWFPQADRESMRILRELGFDLVLHDPATLRASLAKIVQMNLQVDFSDL